MNLSGTLNAFRVLFSPGLCLPHHTVSSFNDLPIPLSKAFRRGEKEADIRAVILDKDNCFAIPHQNEVYAPYWAKFQELRRAYPGSRLLIVSNTAGTRDDPNSAQAKLLERNTGVQVLRHKAKKPGCGDEILSFYRDQKDVDITSPSQIAVVGDRLLTDAMMANMIGSHTVWVKDGIPGHKGFVCRHEFCGVENSVLIASSSPKQRRRLLSFCSDGATTHRTQEVNSSERKDRRLGIPAMLSTRKRTYGIVRITFVRCCCS